ncbi:MFS transporter [Jatrophihabitans sp. DSM 45814]
MADARERGATPVERGNRARSRRGSSGAFVSLSNPNYRKFFFGQAISRIGTWMQTTAQGWLVLQLTGSGTALGLVIACQTLPVLLLGPYGGVIADRMDRLRLLVWLESAMGGLALVLGVLTATHEVRLWQVYILAFCLGLLNAFELPARQTFVHDMVGRDALRNAVSLNSVLNNAARAIGPGIAGVIIGVGGTSVCFMVNALSYVAVVASLLRMDRSRLTPALPTPREKGQLRAGFSYVRSRPSLGVPLLMMTIIGVFAFEFQVTLPVIAKDTFHGGSQAYGFITAAMGIGAVLGGIFAAGHGRMGIRPLAMSAALFGIALTLATVAPNLYCALILMLFVGAGSVTVSARGNTTLQLGADEHMRGRVMALFSVATMGTTPIGGPIVGAAAQHLGARAGLAMGAAGAFLASAVGAVAARRIRADRNVQSPIPDVADEDLMYATATDQDEQPEISEGPINKEKFP